MGLQLFPSLGYGLTLLFRTFCFLLTVRKKKIFFDVKDRERTYSIMIQNILFAKCRYRTVNFRTVFLKLERSKI
jgi:hypothetical protein